MIQRISQAYCQMSSLITGFFIVFAFLFGIRTYIFWATMAAPFIAIGLMLMTAIGLSVAAYIFSEKLRLFIYSKLPSQTGTCSINRHTK